MEGSSSQHFQDQNKGLGFESLNFSDNQILDVSNAMNADVLSQEVQNLALKDSMNGNENEKGGPVESKDVKHRTYLYPLRPQADNCQFFMRHGWCKFGANCKYNHPFKSRSKANKKKTKPKEEDLNRTGQVDGKYNLKPEGRKHEQAFKYNHSGQKTEVAPILQFNLLGLPIRPGEKECPHYRRNGSCKYGLNCWFDHPEPSSMGGGFTLSYYTGLEGTVPYWSSAGPTNDIGLFEPPHMYQPTQCAPYPQWIGYQVSLEHHEAPMYTTSGKSQFTPPAISMNAPASDAKSYPQHQQRVLVKEFPKPDVQPEGNFKFGFGSHHPKTSSCPLNDKGLPLRPDTEVCAFYNMYGVCKHGPACKFDHPITLAKSVPAAAGSEEAQLPNPTTEDKN